jgi:hypothetical protein
MTPSTETGLTTPTMILRIIGHVAAAADHSQKPQQQRSLCLKVVARSGPLHSDADRRDAITLNIETC